jgi:hypothetical protein
MLGRGGNWVTRKSRFAREVVQAIFSLYSPQCLPMGRVAIRVPALLDTPGHFYDLAQHRQVAQGRQGLGPARQPRSPYPCALQWFFTRRRCHAV